jgi:hypothetical protein
MFQIIKKVIFEKKIFLPKKFYSKRIKPDIFKFKDVNTVEDKKTRESMKVLLLIHDVSK